jgi:ATP/maltotriose-dependent transcriptional regulator MalT
MAALEFFQVPEEEAVTQLRDSEDLQLSDSEHFFWEANQGLVDQEFFL